MKTISTRLILTTLLAVLLLLPALFPASLEAQNERIAMRQSNASPIKKLPDKSKRYALVVGVDEYQDQEIAGLKGAANDARLLAKTLIENAGFDPENVKVVATGEPAGRQPTRGNILKLLSLIQNNMPKDGLLLFSFAGHGMDREGKAYLLPTDAQISGDIGLLEDTSIKVEGMSERIRRSGIKQVMLILDACRNNPEGRGLDRVNNNKLTNAYTRGFDFEARNQNIEAFVKLYSTSIGELAYEDKEKDQGYFTYALVEALKGAAANQSGEVTLASLVKYVQEQVPKRIQSDYGKNKSQRPWADMQGYKADELVFSITIKVEIAGRKPSGADAATIELEFWNSVKDSRDAEDFREYLKQYPNGTFAGLARNKLRQLEEDVKRTIEPKVKKETSPVNTNPIAETPKQEAANTIGTAERARRDGYVQIPAGEFMMGSDNGRVDEKPVHKVRISKAFEMGKYEVTQAQWEVVMGSNPSGFKGANLPVETVSWDDVQLYISKMNAKSDGYKYRLPTEAEWEYACRAGTTGDYAGNLDAMAWYISNSGNTTHPVGQRQPNAWGLYDMHGNVYEWCSDWYWLYAYGEVMDPIGGSSVTLRVDRGGSWGNDMEGVRTSARYRNEPTIRSIYLGFRLVRTYN